GTDSGPEIRRDIGRHKGAEWRLDRAPTRECLPVFRARVASGAIAHDGEIAPELNAREILQILAGDGRDGYGKTDEQRDVGYAWRSPYASTLILRSPGLQGQGVSTDGQIRGPRRRPSFETHPR
ncbi:MAG: hypothetical protein JO230_19265, partial [Xanthobacteraceae bacterium]|nr:hypothetical protein [Xanthobacteraceae bacterium]